MKQTFLIFHNNFQQIAYSFGVSDDLINIFNNKFQISVFWTKPQIFPRYTYKLYKISLTAQ